ncbi:hypothetical protein BJ912DRAFT_994396, partial [Pholiota molesta]
AAGGADFYAAPLDISDATNVTLQYSVFFPADFDWVLAGKLPGLYGGHTGCSGGNAARTCFSTRLMWRQEGAGELYLDKQTKSSATTHSQAATKHTACQSAAARSDGQPDRGRRSSRRSR